MSKKPDYGRATNSAYEFLISQNVDLPFIDVFELIMSLTNVKLHTYSECAAKCGCSTEYFKRHYASSEHGFTITDGNKSIICYNELKDEKTIKFTIPHELGHIVLKHKEDDTVANKEADCFARNILCPIPIVDKYGLSTKTEYTHFFGISEIMAEPAILYYPNDSYYITESNYAKLRNMIDARIDRCKRAQYGQFAECVAIENDSFSSLTNNGTTSYITI